MTCLLKLDSLVLQHELAADGCLIILLIQSRISWVNNLAQHPHYISSHPKLVRRATNCDWLRAVGGDCSR